MHHGQTTACDAGQEGFPCGAWEPEEPEENKELHTTTVIPAQAGNQNILNRKK